MRLQIILALASSVVFGSVSTPVLADWPETSQALGARDHPKIMARFGGAISDETLAAYVNDIGQNIAQHSSKPDELWRFIVLDSPEVNAFALPAGYVYVTRGLLALANNEAELAAVLAHEITHVIDEHVEQREAANKDAIIDGAIGALVQGIFGGDGMNNAIRDNIESAFGEIGAYSREQEFAADRGSVILLALAGYAPQAQADFLASMSANSALRAVMAGRGYDAEKVPFFANHPAPEERVSVARDLADGLQGNTNTAVYLDHIDGLIYGDSVEQGFVRGQVFSHPVLGFTFTAQDGQNIRNSARKIDITGPRGSTLIMTGAADEGGSLSRYLGQWAENIPRRERIGRRMTQVRSLSINGMEAATGSITIRRNARRGDLQLTVIRFNGQLIRFAGFSRNRDTLAKADLMDTVLTFSTLNPEQIRSLNSAQIDIHKVKRRDTAERLGASFPQPDFGAELFLVLNGMDTEDTLERGAYVKIIVESP